MGAAILTAVLFGIYITRRKSRAKLVPGVAGMIMIIPSIALSGITIPMFFRHQPGNRICPGLHDVGLILPQLPVIRNTHMAVKGVDPGPDRHGMGMALLQRHRHMPIVPPVIMAGVRTAVVCTIASPRCRLIDAGGLEEYISRGISTFMGLSQTNGTKVGIAVFYSHPSNRGPVQ